MFKDDSKRAEKNQVCFLYDLFYLLFILHIFYSLLNVN